MKNFFTLIAVLVFVLAGCSKEKTIQVKGTLNGTNTEMIYFRELGVGGKVAAKDSMRIDAKGYFAFKQKISQPTFYSLTVNDKIVTILVRPGEKVVLSGDARHLPVTYNVEGSEDSKNIRRLSQRLDHTVFVGDSLDKTLQKFIGNRNFVNIQRQFEWNYINEVDSLRAYNIRFINQNPQSLVVIYALYQQLAPNIFLFSHEEDIKYFRVADSIFFKRYPEVPFVKSLHANVIEMNEQYRIKKLNRMLSMLGRDAPEIALQSPDGQIKKLSSLKGKYVLLDFWASWSPECRTENVNLLNTYNTYRNRGFDVFQVSLDQSRSPWERAIKEDGLPWTNVCDFKFWDSEIVKEYGVETIPTSFLIDKDGSIISKGLKGEALNKKLDELFLVTE